MTTSYMSPSDRPVVDGLQSSEITFAKDQPEYTPIRALVGRSPMAGNWIAGAGRAVLTRWAPSDSQRLAIVKGADIFLELLTFGQPLQPILMIVSDSPDDIAFDMGFADEVNALKASETKRQRAATWPLVTRR